MIKVEESTTVYKNDTISDMRNAIIIFIGNRNDKIDKVDNVSKPILILFSGSGF